MRWHSCMFDVQTSRVADYDTDLYVVVKVRERLSANKHSK